MIAVRDDGAGPGKAAGGTSPRVEGKSGIVATGGAEIVIHLHGRRSGRAGGPMLAVRDELAGPAWAQAEHRHGWREIPESSP